LRIPRLGLNVAVVPTTWEPPPFIVGEVKGSANIGQGNTVLVGHLTGAAGAVFKQLDDLAPGDPVVAVSRGVEYTFTVSDKQTLPADDSEPIAPDDRPHLTLMTCTGTWDPIAHNYSDRLWVTAEPPELAAATIAANAARPPTPVPTSTGDLVDDSVDAGPMDSPAPSNVTGIGSVSVPGGLGAARPTFDAAYGPPVGETPSKLVVYRKGSVEYHVRFTPDPPRARVITLASTDGSGTLSPATAVERVQALFPPDARVLRLVGPESDAGVFVGRMASAELAKAMELRLGHFLVAYSRNAAGVITQSVAAVGDNLDAAIKESSN
jgi:LPXTG-site transpeptidase (sortase) family protein